MTIANRTTLVSARATTSVVTKGKSLTHAQNQRVRAAAEALLPRYGTRTALGKALGVTQAAASAFLDEKNGASEELHRVPDGALPVLGSLPGAHEALVRAKRREPFFPPRAWEDAMQQAAGLITPPYVTPEMLVYAARLAIEMRSATELEQGEADRAEAEEADREHGGAALHEGCHHLLHGTQHTHADVIQMTLCLAVPWATVRAAVRAGALTPEALSHRQRHAPLWLLEWRCEVIAKVFAGYDVA